MNRIAAFTIPFALFKFVQSVAAAVAFGYGTFLTLKYQLIILVVSALFGTLAFLFVERSMRNAVQDVREFCNTNSGIKRYKNV